MKKLYSSLTVLSSQPECKSCRLCEEHVGLVYLLGREAASVTQHGLRVLQAGDGVEYLERKPTGWCSAFDSRSNTCTIYSDRPLCCRIYPLDLMKLDGV